MGHNFYSYLMRHQYFSWHNFPSVKFHAKFSSVCSLILWVWVKKFQLKITLFPYETKPKTSKKTWLAIVENTIFHTFNYRSKLSNISRFGKSNWRKIVTKCSLAPWLSTKIYFFEISSRFSERLGLGRSPASFSQHGNS